MQNPRVNRFLSLALVILAACKSDPKREPAPPAPAASASTLAAPGTPQPVPSTPAQLMDIPQRFAFEATHRPAGTITAEQVFTSFGEQGLVLTEVKQHLAKPFGASYCKGAKAEKEQQAFSVCEYETAAEAEAGIGSAKAFGTDKRDVIRNGNSVLIARWEAADAGKAEQIFRSLKAPSKTP